MSQIEKSKKTFLLVNIITAVIGSVVAYYSISHHLDLKLSGATDALCNINQTVSCDAVANSKYSELFGIPLGAYGLSFFLAIFFLSMIEMKSKPKNDTNFQALLSLSFIGAAVSLVLGGISSFVVGAICLTCIGIYILSAVLLGNSIILMRSGALRFSPASAVNGLTTAAIVTGITLLTYGQIAPTSDPTQHPNHVSNSPHNLDSDAAPTLSSKTFDVPVNLSAYSGFGEDFRIGSDQARVTIVEFADMQCPACATVSATLRQIAQRYGNRVNIVFKNYPLDQACNSGINRTLHEHACSLAAMARCAGQKGKFWEYHDFVFANQNGVEEGSAEAWAKRLGLSDEEITACKSNKAIIAKIRDDIKLGNEVGVQGTPSIYINGKKLLANPSFGNIMLEVEKILAN